MSLTAILFAIALTNLRAEEAAFSTGTEHLGGADQNRFSLPTDIEGKPSEIVGGSNATAPSGDATGDLPPDPQGGSTYSRVFNKPLESAVMPSFNGPSPIGQDYSPINSVNAYRTSDGYVRTPFEFKPEDYIRFTPLEPAQVGGVRGYMGTAYSNGMPLMMGNRPQEFFVPQDQMNRMHSSTIQDMLGSINRSNRTVGHQHDDDCEHESKEPYPEVEAEQVAVPRKDGYLPGCQALAVTGGPGAEHESQLQECLQSIKEAVASVSRKNGSINRELWMCNVMAQLNPQEQEFAGLIFTSAVEAGVISTDPNTGEPKYKETAFVMKVMQNRTRQIQKDLGNQYNALDVALAHKQFSMYNSGEFNKFRSYFEPGSNSSKDEYDAAIKGYLALQKDLIQPKPLVDNMDMYFNPNGMVRGRSSNRARLIEAGLIPSNYPSDRKVPAWEFSKLTYVTDLNFDGRPVRSTPPFRHAFYSSKSGVMFYGVKDGIKERRSQCGGNQTALVSQLSWPFSLGTP